MSHEPECYLSDASKDRIPAEACHLCKALRQAFRRGQWSGLLDDLIDATSEVLDAMRRHRI